MHVLLFYSLPYFYFDNWDTSTHCVLVFVNFL